MLITGTNQGLGFVTARELARAGAQVFIACRSQERAHDTVERIAQATGTRVEQLPLDLADLGSVRRAARHFLARQLPLHVLINNAGVVGARGTTREGFEIAFGVNHLGHFLLTRELLPCLIASAPARVVTVAGHGHYAAEGIPFEVLRSATASRTGMREAAVSKLANVLFSAELSRRLEATGVTSYALHPGMLATGVWRHAPAPLRGLMGWAANSPEHGARTSLYCATAPELAQQTGLYYAAQRAKQASSAARDPKLATELWLKSELWTRETAAP